MTNSVNRLPKSVSRIVSCCSPNLLIPSRRPVIKTFSTRQLSWFDLNSLVPSRGSHFRCISTATSPCSSKVLQGHPPSFSDSATGYRSYSSAAEHGCPKARVIEGATKGVQMGDSEMDTQSLPTESWTPESLELYKKLTSDLIEQGNGDWVKHRTSLYSGERRLFTKAVVSELPGKFFEYQFFFSKKEQRLKGVIQFGPYTQGPPGCVHGGASASMMDSAIGVCVNRCFSHCVTATLNINYKSLLPLGSTAMVESWVEKVEGRKIFGSAELKSPDGKVTYLTANALFIQLDPNQGKAKVAADKMQQIYGKTA